MEYNLRTAIVEMKKQEESGINYIYAKTYNYVYLRAKNILRRENDVQQLMKDVYVKMIESSAEVEVDNLYEWLGEYTYRLGCGCYRKKKVREAEVLETANVEFIPRMIEYPEATTDIISKSLEELPDLYQATFYAFYYDYMSIERISDLMDSTPGVILNRLNYARKYMIKALENYYEETKVPVFYSIEGVCTALRKWSVDHCLGITVAQSVYADICKTAGVQPAPIYLEGKEFAGVNNTVVFHKADDYNFLEEQADKYGEKRTANKKAIGIVAGVLFAIGIVLLIAVAIMNPGSSTKKDNKEDKKDTTKIEEQQKEETDTVDSDEDLADDEIAGETESKDYIFPESDTKPLSRAELEGLSKEELRLARNEIFARHGMIFGVADLDEYFGAKSWYKATIPSGEFYNRVEMSLTEEANVALILEVEGTK